VLSSERSPHVSSFHFSHLHIHSSSFHFFKINLPQVYQSFLLLAYLYSLFQHSSRQHIPQNTIPSKTTPFSFFHTYIVLIKYTACHFFVSTFSWLSDPFCSPLPFIESFIQYRIFIQCKLHLIFSKRFNLTDYTTIKIHNNLNIFNKVLLRDNSRCEGNSNMLHNHSGQINTAKKKLKNKSNHLRSTHYEINENFTFSSQIYKRPFITRSSL